MLDTALDLSAWVIPVLSAIILHELAHGWVAEKFGDPTARLLGRITLNPIRHIDPVGSVLFPAALIAVGSPVVFGSAKAVPVNFAALTPPRLGMAAVALAGPLVNVLLALLVGILLHVEIFLPPEEYDWLFKNLYRALMLNCVLASFNMLPFLPLDGGRVVAACLRGRALMLWNRLERFGIVILLALLLIPPFFGVFFLQDALILPAFYLLEAILWVTGNSE